MNRWSAIFRKDSLNKRRHQRICKRTSQISQDANFCLPSWWDFMFDSWARNHFLLLGNFSFIAIFSVTEYHHPATTICAFSARKSMRSSGTRMDKNERVKNLLFIQFYSTMCKTHIFCLSHQRIWIITCNMRMNKWIKVASSFCLPFAKCHEKLMFEKKKVLT